MRTLKILTIATVLAAAAAGSATAQQVPNDSGTDANGPITILKNMVAEPDGVRVSIDGREVDRLQTATYGDITGDVHKGQNTLTVQWNAPVPKLNFKIAYAPTRNNFRTVIVVQADSSRDAALRQAGSRSYTFTIPG